MNPVMRSTKMRKARWDAVLKSLSLLLSSRVLERAWDAILEKSVVPVKAFQPDCLLSISSACGLGEFGVDNGGKKGGWTYGAYVHVFGAVGTGFACVGCEVEYKTRDEVNPGVIGKREKGNAGETRPRINTPAPCCAR